MYAMWGSTLLGRPSKALQPTSMGRTARTKKARKKPLHKEPSAFRRRHARSSRRSSGGRRRRDKPSRTRTRALAENELRAPVDLFESDKHDAEMKVLLDTPANTPSNFC
eukprot:scaffold31967_cov66-Phaeocystis_antarctica.AAC.5